MIEISSHSRRVPTIFTSAFGAFEVGKGVGTCQFGGNMLMAMALELHVKSVANSSYS